jgi:hypothetical protein
MTMARAIRAADGATPFNPTTGEIIDEPAAHWTGKRREFVQRPAEPWRYPLAATRQQQYNSFDAGQRYWSTHVHQERAKLARQGLSPKEVDVEISRYATAIGRHLDLQKQYGSTPDGAA